MLGPTHPVPQALPAIHERLLVIVPDPHRVEQALHCPNAVHRELTGMKRENRIGKSLNGTNIDVLSIFSKNTNEIIILFIQQVSIKIQLGDKF